jgi:hypothetical protein
MLSNLVNQVGVNAVWLACVLGAAYGHGWLGTLCALAWIAWILYRHAHWRRELGVVLFAGALGFAADLVLIRFGGLAYVDQPPGLPGPIWIVALWMAFGTSLNVSLAWLHGRAWLAAVLGAVSGPLAYIAGRKLGAVDFGPPDREPLLVLSLVWAVALPLLVIVAARAHPQGPDVPPKPHADDDR